MRVSTGYENRFDKPSITKVKVLMCSLQKLAFKVYQKACVVDYILARCCNCITKIFTTNSLFPVIWNTYPERTSTFYDISPLISCRPLRTLSR